MRKTSPALLLIFGFLIASCGGSQKGLSVEDAGNYWDSAASIGEIEKPAEPRLYEAFAGASSAYGAYNGSDSAEDLARRGLAFTSNDAVAYSRGVDRAMKLAEEHEMWIESEYAPADCAPVSLEDVSAVFSCIADNEEREIRREDGLLEVDEILAREELRATSALAAANGDFLRQYQDDLRTYEAAVLEVDRPIVEFASIFVGDLPPQDMATRLCPVGSYEFFITRDSVGTRDGGFIILSNRNGKVDPASGIQPFGCKEGRASIGEPMSLDEVRSKFPGINEWFHRIAVQEDPTGFTQWPENEPSYP